MPISVKHMQWLPSVMLVFGCSLLCLLVNGNRSFVEIDLTNSDVLLPASYIWDIKKHGYAWTGFQLPRIPSLFPDLVTYGALHLLFGDFRWAYLVYSLLQTLVFVALAGHLIGRAVGAPTADAALLFLVVISVVVGSNLQTARLNYVFSIFLPVVHFGSLVMSLAGGALALSLIEKWRSWPAAVFTICVFLAFLSNRKFLFDFMVPFFAATLVLAALNRLSWRRAGHLALCVGAGVALALVGDEFLHRQPNLRMGDLTSYAQTFFREVPGYLVSRGFAAVVTFLVPYIVSVAFVLVWLGQRYVVATPAGTEPIVHEPSDIEPIFLGILGIVAVVSCIAALAAVYVDYDAFRHADPAIFWPIILTSAAVLHILRQRVTNFSYVCIMAVAVMIGILNGTSGFSPPLLHWQHPLAACLSAKREALGLKAGLSDYWLSRPTTISTNWRIQVDQIAEMGEPYYWGNDKNWYLKSFADPDRSPEYNFVVVTRLDTLALRERFGSPDRTETCGAHTVWLYDDSAALYRRLKPSSQ